MKRDLFIFCTNICVPIERNSHKIPSNQAKDISGIMSFYVSKIYSKLHSPFRCSSVGISLMPLYDLAHYMAAFYELYRLHGGGEEKNSSSFPESMNGILCFAEGIWGRRPTLKTI